MFDKLILLSIKNKLIVSLAMVALIGWGIYSITRLPIDAVPDITDNQVQVITLSPSLGATDVERLVSFPLEFVMATIPEIKEIRSISRFGLSVVTIVFSDNIDVYWARQQVSERLGQVSQQIPTSVGIPILAPVTTGLGEIYQYTLHPKKGYETKYSIMDLRTIQDWIVRRQLLGTKGVADVSSFGGYLKQYEISVNTNELKSYNISIDEIFTALQANNQNTGGAYIEKQSNAYFIRSEGLVTSLKDIKNIVVKTNKNGLPVIIDNIAKVSFGNAVRYGAMTRNNDGEVVGAVVMMLKGENSSQVIQNVKERIEQIRKNLPESIEIEAYLDRTKLVNSAIGTVTTNLIEGACIVIFVLIFMLGSLRAGLVVASVIPLAMLFAISMMNLFNVSGNLMSLGAIDFGLLVDGAVIIVEAVMHHLSLRTLTNKLSQDEMDAEVYDASSKIRSAAAFGEIIIMIVYLPILVLSGIEGKMFRPMAQTVAFAIFGAFILSITYVPMMASWALSKKVSTKKNFSDKFIDACNRLYQPLLIKVLNFRKLWVGVSIVLLVISGVLFTTLGGEFIPTLEEGDFAVETRIMAGGSLSKTIEVTQKASKILMDNFPEVKSVVGKIGSSEIPLDPMPIEACDMLIVLKDKKDWTTTHDLNDLAIKMQATLERYIVGVSFGFQQPIQMRFNELMTGIRQDVAIKIYGENLDVLLDIANKTAKIAAKVEGVSDLYVEKLDGLPQIVVTPDRNELARYGLSIETLNKTLQTAFAGANVGIVYEGEKRFDMVLRLEKVNRQSIDDVKGLYITTSDGKQIPMEQVAAVELKNSPNEIRREDAKRRIAVAFNVRGKDVETVVKELQTKLEKQIKLPAGYYTTFGGQFQNLQEAKDRLLVAVPVALLLIFVLLYFTTNSIKQSLLIFSAVPLSAIGGIIALVIRQMPFSISAGVGFIALFGVSVLNGLVMIGEFNRILKDNPNKTVTDAIIEGTKTRLRPVLMTAMVASFGFLPMAISNGAGAEVQKPLATVVIGGLFSATLLTLFILPCLFIMTQKIKTKVSSLLIIFATIFIIVASNFSVTAQNISNNSFTMNEAIGKAKEVSKSVSIANYQIDYQRLIKKTTSDIGKTSLTWQAGQYNSFEKDNAFTVMQSFPFPTTFAKRQQFEAEQINSRKIALKVTENELVYQVKNAYCQTQYFIAKQNLFKIQDSIFKNLTKASNLRYTTGEGTYLQKINAESRSQQVTTFLQQSESDFEIAQIQLQTYLNVDRTVSLSEKTLSKRIILAKLDTNKVTNNPNLLYLKQQIVIQEKNIGLEKNAFLPDFTVGYFNQSLIGTYNRNNQEVFYGSSQRFQGFYLGVSLPLWVRPQNQRLKASKLNQKIAETEFELSKSKLKGQYLQVYQQYLKLQNSISYYEVSALPQADLILEKSSQSFKAGEISFLEYTQSLDNALSVKFQYLDFLYQHNLIVNQLEYLLAE
jgi:heavy metal efflux system protein